MMGQASPSPQDLRRSSRISVTIPLEVRSQNPDGSETLAACTTKYVNRHGGLLLSEQMLLTDSEVTLYAPSPDASAALWPARFGA